VYAPPPDLDAFEVKSGMIQSSAKRKVKCGSWHSGDISNLRNLDGWFEYGWMGAKRRSGLGNETGRKVFPSGLPDRFTQLITQGFTQPDYPSELLALSPCIFSL